MRDVGADARLPEDGVRRGDRAPADTGQRGGGGEAADRAVVVGMAAEDLGSATRHRPGQRRLALGDREQHRGYGDAGPEGLRDRHLADDVLARLGLPRGKSAARGGARPGEQVRAHSRRERGRHSGSVEAGLSARRLEAVGAHSCEARGSEPDAPEADQRALRALMLPGRYGLHDGRAHRCGGDIDDQPRDHVTSRGPFGHRAAGRPSTAGRNAPTSPRRSRRRQRRR